MGRDRFQGPEIAVADNGTILLKLRYVVLMDEQNLLLDPGSHEFLNSNYELIQDNAIALDQQIF